jgi:hypothetical protein
MPKVEILYLAWGRREFTEASLEALLENTNWDLVEKLWIYTDGSAFPFEGFRNFDVVTEKFGSPVAIMNAFLSISSSNLFIKLDNDVVVPPGWLDEGLRLMDENPHVDLLGIEAHLRPPEDNRKIIGRYSEALGIRYTDHIGGIGFMRRRAFEHGTMVANGRQGFTQFQWANPQIVKAWIDPPLRVFLLDHLPFEPWRSLSEEYIAKGWQRRQWGCYGPEWSGLWDWWRPAALETRQDAPKADGR